jgi:hypothetical protein
LSDLDPAPQTDRDDLDEVWVYAINAALAPAPSEDDVPERRQELAEARREQFHRYARYVLHDLDVDLDRFAAVEREAVAKAATDRSRWASTVELVEAVREVLRQTGADTDPGAREELRAQLIDEKTWDPPPYRQGPWHRYSTPRRILRRGDPRYWLRRLTARATVRFVSLPASTSTNGFQEIEMRRGDVEVGHLKYKVCTLCKIGYVGKVSVVPDLQGRGLATGALAAARRDAPGARWCTTRQYVTAVTFWQGIGRRTGAGYRTADDDLRPCVHIDGERTRVPGPVSTRPAGRDIGGQ